MTRRRRTANPMFQRPLTTAELTKIPKPVKHPGKLITCLFCGEPGFGGLHKSSDGKYFCNNMLKCHAARRQKELVMGMSKGEH